MVNGPTVPGFQRPALPWVQRSEEPRSRGTNVPEGLFPDVRVSAIVRSPDRVLTSSRTRLRVVTLCSPGNMTPWRDKFRRDSYKSGMALFIDVFRPSMIAVVNILR